MRFDFEGGTTQGWSVTWGSTLSLANEVGTAYSGSHGLALDVTGTGYPGAGVRTGLTGLGPGSPVTYHVFAPSGVNASTSPMLLDSGWKAAVLPAQSLQAGWNTVTFTIPTTVSGVNELGLQVDDSSGWSGRLVLDAVAF